MDQTDHLEALSNLLTELSTHPYDISLHAQHILLAVATGLQEQVDSAREMFTSFYAATDDIWLPLIEGKVNAGASAVEVLELFEKSERDYLSMQLLSKHIQFLIEKHAYYLEHHAESESDEEVKTLFNTEATRSAISEVVAKGAGHLTQSQLLWDVQRDWELEALERAPQTDREPLVSYIDSLYLARLRQPHANNDETFQSYSTFTTNHKPPQEYETLLVNASKLRAQAVKAYQRRERLELPLSQEPSLAGYAAYIAYELRAKRIDPFVVTTVYERAIAAAARRRFGGEVGAEETLRAWWSGYLDTLRVTGAPLGQQLDTAKRALRSVPGSGEMWARYIRILEKLDIASTSDQPDPMDVDAEDKESVADAYTRAMGTGLFASQKDVEQIVPLILARAGYEKRALERGAAEADAFSVLVGVVEEGMNLIREVFRGGDPRLRLEKFLSSIYQDIVEVPESAISLWHSTTKHKLYRNSYLAWIEYTNLLIKQNQHELVRSTFDSISAKQLDWPEAIWEAWIAFEHLHGSVEDYENATEKIEKARGIAEARRTKEAEKAGYQAVKVSMEQQAASVPAEEVVQSQHPNGEQTESVAMDVDHPPAASTNEPTADQGRKRKAEESPAPEAGGSKRVKAEPIPPPLKRDRENCTVFVSDLPLRTTEEELNSLFKDCGQIRGTKITELPNALVATVEFLERDSVPAALTKDKKRIRGQEISVHLAWQSTLYVTNFPEHADDEYIRKLFGQYGTLFDVRWPSKKFKNTRRFVYVQYTSPNSAKEALVLHGYETDPGLPLNVYISNPERKKERTDADANAREVYVAGLSKFTKKEDLERVFRTYGPLKEIRMIKDTNGSAKGFAFVEFKQEADAQAALGANNYELRSRRIAVTLADTRVRAKPRNNDTGLGRQSEKESRTLRIRNLPPTTQEPLLQQALEKTARVQRVEVFGDLREAVVELESAAEAGKLLLRPEPIVFNGNTLEFVEALASSRPTAPPPKAGGLFVPRAALSRPRAGLGKSRAPGVGSSDSAPSPVVSGRSQPAAVPQQGKGQDDFRKMLDKK